MGVGGRPQPLAQAQPETAPSLAMAQLRSADVLGALDTPAVYSVWRLARMNPDAAAISGVQPVLEHLGLAG